MSESTDQVKRIARMIRDEADAMQERHIASNGGRLQDPHPENPDFQRGWIEALRRAADLGDDGRGG